MKNVSLQDENGNIQHKKDAECTYLFGSLQK